MFRRPPPPPPSTPPRKKWHPDDDEQVLYGQQDDQQDSHQPAQTEPHPSADHAADQSWPSEEVVDLVPAHQWAEEQQTEPQWTAVTEDAAQRITAEAPAPEAHPAEPQTSEHPAFEQAAPATVPAQVSQSPAPQPPHKQRTQRKQQMRRKQQAQPTRTRPQGLRWGWVALPLVLLVLAASWFALPIREVAVSGNQHLSAAEVVRSAGVTPDFGWLYYSARQAQGLTQNPWIASAEVTREFPDRLRIQVTERTPYAVLRESGSEPVAVAHDGTHLPGAALDPALPTVSGWGPERTADALAALDATRRYGVQSVEYTPTGLAVKSAAGSAWSGDLESLLKYAGEAMANYPDQTIHIYPWGVSVQE